MSGYYSRKYYEAVGWIAANDDEAETDPAEVAQQITVAMVADLYRWPAAKVAADVLAARKAIFEKEGRA